MTMTAEQLAQLREVAERAAWGNWQAYKPHKGARGYEVKNGVEAVAQHCIKHDAGFIASANPKTVLALLDELEQKYKRIAELEAQIEINTDYESEIVEALDISGLLSRDVTFTREDILELMKQAVCGKARTVTVKLPEYYDMLWQRNPGGSYETVEAISVMKIKAMLIDAGINLTVDG